MLLPPLLFHVAQGMGVSAATVIAEANGHSTLDAVITATGGVATVFVANITADWVKRRRGRDTSDAEKARKLRVENTALRRKLKAAEAKNARKETPPHA